ncbi:hypothetical protein FI667_g2244, partial [Globisporangium splendens]
MDDEEHRVCDLCIQVVDEKLAEGLNKRFGKHVPPSDNQSTHEQKEAETPLPPDRNTNRAVLTTGRYRADIKESEGNSFPYAFVDFDLTLRAAAVISGTFLNGDRVNALCLIGGDFLSMICTQSTAESMVIFHFEKRSTQCSAQPVAWHSDDRFSHLRTSND